MALDFDERGSSGFMRDPSPELSAFLSRRGHSTENFFGFNRATEWREGGTGRCTGVGAPRRT
jgi:hypothetical protein